MPVLPSLSPVCPVCGLEIPLPNPFPSKLLFLRRQVGRARKLAHWAVTGQLVRQLRDRRGQIRARWEYLLESLRMRLGLRADLRQRLGLPPAFAVPAPSALALATSDSPVLSILIPTYGKVDYTLRCLASIAAHPPKAPFEVLVVDDASGDPAVAGLREVRGLSLTERTTNLGFLLSCNDAAKLARGSHLLLLNNDTEVMPGALDALFDTFEAHPDAGLVGARLLYPDGWQQEAGGLVWRDGTAWNDGHQDDPRKPAYNYLRDADYISGAAIMLPLALWRELGGFDPHYAPAYCEDTDLAFRVRAAGRRVLYQPRAIVIHHEGVSHGTDVTQGLKAHQVTNFAKLRERWAETLEANHLPVGTRLMRARDRALHRRIALVIDNNLPEPDRDAGSRCMVGVIDALQARGRVVKFWPLNGQRTPGYTEALQGQGVEVLHGPWSGSFAAWIAENGAEIDEILVSRPHVAAATLPQIRAHSRAPVIFYGHDLHHARLRREAELLGSAALRAEAASLLAEETAIWHAADLSLYLSEEEVAAVRAIAPEVPVGAITPYALPPLPAEAPRPEGRVGLLFVAGFGHPPNEDAACWFVTEILPLIRAALPGVALTLAGSKPTEKVRALAAPGIEVTGYIPDEELARRYGQARVIICPLRFGAGVKLKVVEALHAGVPLVTTPVGAQGLEGIEAVCAVTADPGDFARHVLRLLTEDNAWTAQAARQRHYAGDRFSAAAIEQRLEAGFAEAAAHAARRIGA